MDVNSGVACLKRSGLRARVAAMGVVLGIVLGTAPAMRGWKGACCDESAYKLVSIDNDNVENEMVYAKTGSDIPEAIHGIWWMDQRGKALN